MKQSAKSGAPGRPPPVPAFRRPQERGQRAPSGSPPPSRRRPGGTEGAAPPPPTPFSLAGRPPGSGGRRPSDEEGSRRNPARSHCTFFSRAGRLRRRDRCRRQSWGRRETTGTGSRRLRRPLGLGAAQRRASSRPLARLRSRLRQVTCGRARRARRPHGPGPAPAAPPKLRPQRRTAACARHGGDLWEVGPEGPGAVPGAVPGLQAAASWGRGPFLVRPGGLLLKTGREGGCGVVSFSGHGSPGGLLVGEKGIGRRKPCLTLWPNGYFSIFFVHSLNWNGSVGAQQ